MANDTSRLPGVWGIDKETSAIPVMPGQRLVAIVAPFLNGAVDRPFIASADNYKELVGGYNSKLSKPDYGYLCLEETLKKAPSVLVCRVADREKLEKGTFQNEMISIRTKFGTEVYNGLDVSITQGGFADEIVLTIGNESYNLSVDPKSDRYIANLGNFSTIYECVSFNPEGILPGGTEPEPEPGEPIKFDKELYAIAISKNPGDWKLSEDKFTMIKDFIPWKEANEILEKEQSGRYVANDLVLRKPLIELKKRNGGDFIDSDLTNPVLSINDNKQLVLTYGSEEPVIIDISEADVNGSIKFSTATLEGKLYVYPIHIGEEPLWKLKSKYIDNILGCKNPFKVSSDKKAITRNGEWLTITKLDGSLFEDTDIYRVFMSKNRDGELQVAFGNETPVIVNITELDVRKYITVETQSVLFKLYITLEREPDETQDDWTDKQMYVNAVLNLVSPFLLSEDRLSITKATNRIVLKRLDGSQFGPGDNRLIVVGKNSNGDLTIKFSDEPEVVIPLARDMVNKVVTAYSDTMKYDVLQTLEPEPTPEPSRKETEYVNALTTLDGKWVATEDNKTIFRNKTLYVSKANGTDVTVSQGQFVRVEKHPEGGLNLSYNNSQPTRVRITEEDIKFGSLTAKVNNETYIFKIILTLPIPKDLPEIDPNEEQNLEEGKQLTPFSESAYQKQLLDEFKDDTWVQDDVDVNTIKTNKGSVKVALLSGLNLSPDDGALVKLTLNLEGKLEVSFNDDKAVLVHIDSENIGRHFKVDGETCRFIFYVTPIYLPQHTVSFYDGETVLKTMTVNQNANWAIPTIEKPGHTLEGYYRDPQLQEKIEGGISVMADVKVYTKWTVKTFGITVFDGDRAVEQKTKSYGEKFTPENHDKEGNELVGYFYDPQFNTKVENFPITVDRNINLYIKYRQNAFDVTLKNADDTQIRVDKVDESTNYTPNDPTKTGYTVAGYWDNKEFSGSKITFPIRVNANKVLYVKYEPVSVTVKFNSNQGSAVDDFTGKFDGLITKPVKDPTKIGHNFVGWYKEEGLKNAWNFETEKIASVGTITLYAKWEVKDVTVTFNANGGTPAPEQKTVKFGAKITPAPSAMTKAKHRFDGWYKEAEFTNKVDFETYVIDKEEVTLFAKWVEQVTITFNSKGGSAVDSITLDKGKVATKPSTDPTLANNVFKGWFKEDATTTAVVWTEPVNVDATYYAKWELVQHTVKIMDGSVELKNVKVAHGSKYQLTTGLTKAEHLLEGIYTDTAMSTGKVSDTNVTVNADITYYSKWTPLSTASTVTFEPATNVQKGDVITCKVTFNKALPQGQSTPTVTATDGLTAKGGVTLDSGRAFATQQFTVGDKVTEQTVTWAGIKGTLVGKITPVAKAVLSAVEIAPKSVASGAEITVTAKFDKAPRLNEVKFTPDATCMTQSVAPAASGNNVVVKYKTKGDAKNGAIVKASHNNIEKQDTCNITAAAAKAK